MMTVVALMTIYISLDCCAEGMPILISKSSFITAVLAFERFCLESLLLRKLEQSLLHLQLALDLFLSILPDGIQRQITHLCCCLRFSLCQNR
jgi:hypothetical protein